MTRPVSTAEKPLIEVVDLSMSFDVRQSAADSLVRRSRLRGHAVDGVSLSIRAGEIVGLVGESGCGKSTLGRLIACLEEPTQGIVRYEGRDLANLSRTERHALRRALQIVFQDPYSTLNPRMRVGSVLAEALRVHGVCPRGEVSIRVGELLELVELNSNVARRRPSQLSGGQRQRVGIARALTVNPKLIVADEPVSSLDVSVQAQILNLINRLKRELGLAWLFIGHNLATVRQVSDRIAVMYLGRIVEEGPADVVLTSPVHPYTIALLESVPQPDPTVPMVEAGISGDPPSPIHLPEGCRFASRCPLVRPFCRKNDPELQVASAVRELQAASVDHRVACFAITKPAEWSGCSTTPESISSGAGQ